MRELRCKIILWLLFPFVLWQKEEERNGSRGKKHPEIQSHANEWKRRKSLFICISSHLSNISFFSFLYLWLCFARNGISSFPSLFMRVMPFASRFPPDWLLTQQFSSPIFSLIHANKHPQHTHTDTICDAMLRLQVHAHSWLSPRHKHTQALHQQRRDCMPMQRAIFFPHFLLWLVSSTSTMIAWASADDSVVWPTITSGQNGQHWLSFPPFSRPLPPSSGSPQRAFRSRQTNRRNKNYAHEFHLSSLSFPSSLLLPHVPDAWPNYLSWQTKGKLIAGDQEQAQRRRSSPHAGHVFCRCCHTLHFGASWTPSYTLPSYTPVASRESHVRFRDLKAWIQCDCWKVVLLSLAFRNIF